MAVLFCVKCREKRDVGNNFKKVTMKNGRPAITAVCPVCGTKMFKIGAA